MPSVLLAHPVAPRNRRCQLGVARGVEPSRPRLECRAVNKTMTASNTWSAFEAAWSKQESRCDDRDAPSVQHEAVAIRTSANALCAA